MRLEFHKIRRLPPYVFEQVNIKKAALRAQGADVIDLGMGNPDLPTPKHIVDKLCETARKPDVHGYSASRGIPGLRRALSAYYDRRFGVKLDPNREVIVTLGSKEGFANLAQAIAAPGDVILAPNPSYPLHSFGFIMAGATIRSVQAHSPEEYLSGLSRAIKHSVPAPTAMVVCYPANPTAQVVDLDFYKEAVPSRRSTSCGSCRILPTPKSISKSRRPRSCRSMGRRTSRWNAPPCRRPIRWRVGASASRPAMSG